MQTITITRKQIKKLAEVIAEEGGMRAANRFTMETTNLHQNEKTGEGTLALKNGRVAVLITPAGQSQRLVG